MTVEVQQPFQVCYGSTVYGPGEVAGVPDAVAQQWIRSGWVVEVDETDEPSARPAPGRRSY